MLLLQILFKVFRLESRLAWQSTFKRFVFVAQLNFILENITCRHGSNLADESAKARTIIKHQEFEAIMLLPCQDWGAKASKYTRATNKHQLY